MNDIKQYTDYYYDSVEQSNCFYYGSIIERAISGASDPRYGISLCQHPFQVSSCTNANRDIDAMKNYLCQRKVFDNMNKISIGDSIYFVIDPSFERCNNRTVILLAAIENREVKILNILDNRESDDLVDLRRQMLEEYQTKGVTKYANGDFFVFSKSSTCRAKRPGEITKANDCKPITEIPGFDPSVSMVGVEVDSFHRDTAYLIAFNNGIPREIREIDITHTNDWHWRYHEGDPLYPVLLSDGEYDLIECQFLSFNRTNFLEQYANGNPPFVAIWNYCEYLSSLFNKYYIGELEESEAKKRICNLNDRIEFILHCPERYVEISLTSNNCHNKTLVFTLLECSWVADDHVDYLIREYVPATVIEMGRFPISPKDIAEVIADFDLPFGWRGNYPDDFWKRALYYHSKITLDPNKMIKYGLILSDAVSLREIGVNFYFDVWDSASGTFVQKAPIKTVKELNDDFVCHGPDRQMFSAPNIT